MKINEAFELMRAKPGTRGRPAIWDAEAGDRWVEYVASDGDWKVLVESRLGRLEHSIALHSCGDLMVSEWDVVQPLAEVVYPRSAVTCFALTPFINAIERAFRDGTPWRVFAEPPTVTSIRCVAGLGCDHAYNAGYATDRWPDRSAVAIVEGSVWLRLPDPEKMSVRQHHSEVVVIGVTAKKGEQQ
jgi:hypothetical protein